MSAKIVAKKVRCLLCGHYRKSKVIDTVNKRPIRRCEEIGKGVQAETEVCEKFVITKFFRCKKGGCDMNPTVCANRHKRRSFQYDEECRKCKQYFDITEALKLHAINEYKKGNRTRLLRKKSTVTAENKPKLRRRSN